MRDLEKKLLSESVPRPPSAPLIYLPTLSQRQIESCSENASRKTHLGKDPRRLLAEPDPLANDSSGSHKACSGVYRACRACSDPEEVFRPLRCACVPSVPGPFPLPSYTHRPLVRGGFVGRGFWRGRREPRNSFGRGSEKAPREPVTLYLRATSAGPSAG